MKIGVLIAMCLLTFGLTAVSRETGTVCKDLSYENRNQTDYGPLRVSAVRGTAKDAQGVAVPKVCVGIFTETDHKLIASTQTDDNGHFNFKNIPEGNYRLVAKYEGFSPANAKLRIERRSRKKKSLAVQMRFAGLDTSSYVELK
jgi:hypothetical protein